MGTTYSKSGDKWQPEASVRVVNPLLLGAASILPLIVIAGIMFASALPRAEAQTSKVQLTQNQPLVEPPTQKPGPIVQSTAAQKVERAPEPQKSPQFAPVAVPQETQAKRTGGWLGSVEIGAFSGEAAHLAGVTHVSTYGFADSVKYGLYRDSVRATYGADLEDMNYFSLKQENFKDRAEKLERWILMAGQYGDVTIALEPLGEEKYQIFHDAAAMEHLSRAFQRAEGKGITIWIRFASEANLRGSKYSATHPAVADEFYQAAKVFKSQMPKNVKLVFSPLINTFEAGGSTQKQLARRMYYGGNPKLKLWDRIGGTIYRTTQPILPMYEDYYAYMHELDPGAPFQICEVGGPYSKRTEVLVFLQKCGEGQWPKLEKVNLFARDINSRADPQSEFGFLEPTGRAQKSARAKDSGKPQLMDSYIKPLISAD